MKIGIAGCTGRMGQLLTKEVLSANDCYLTGGITRDKENFPNNVPILKDAEDLFAVSDLVIDFTAPEASLRHARIAASAKKPLIIGTTGISESQMSEIREAAIITPILYTPNASLGVNLLSQIVKKAAKILGQDFAIEIIEAHHGKKVDAPSGTALALGKSAAEGRDVSFSSKAVYDRHGHTGARTKDEIGFSVIRGGDIVGEHTVMFLGNGERLELTHRATDRALFARGALHAARWLIKQPAGFYNMQDFLNLD
ncbi:MAG TPA: 4-hydroxy-tetrahydrodipicolinate reductase [Alphaproteobacteria bacterium]|jgi:4-hydroxy-tetrahydrodipicolinate reductase|nr:4-hydroxy-tetrahydrodipicolinate reductase [Alphaproteobacteria bacterium]HRK97382.1 4-hydroxy-tetrahydrodipicolinate reductase [Alphaproteobacteria bacterium]